MKWKATYTSYMNRKVHSHYPTLKKIDNTGKK